mgnify:CR=1 FL=1
MAEETKEKSEKKKSPNNKKVVTNVEKIENKLKELIASKLGSEKINALANYFDITKREKEEVRCRKS